MASKVTLYDEDGVPHTSTTVERATDLAVRKNPGIDKSKLTTTAPTIGNTGPTVESPQQAAQSKFTAAKATEGTTGGTSPSGTLTAQITTPTSLKKSVPPPAVVTSDAAEKDLTNKKAQVNQFQADTDAHQAAVNAPAVVTTTEQQKTGQQPTQPPTLDEQINEMLGGLQKNNEEVDAAAAKQVSPLQAEQQRIQARYDKDYAAAINKLNKIATGTYPLSPAEKDLLSSTRDTYLSTIEAQKTANTGFEGQMTEALASLGISSSAPTQAIGLMHTVISSGNEKVADLNAKMAKSLADLRLGFQENDYKMVSDSWDKAAKYTTDRLDTLKDMQDSIMAAAKQQKQDTKDYTTLALQYVVKSAEFSYEQKQDLIQNAFTERQINETARHNLQSEAVSWHNALRDDNAGFKLGQPQVSKLLAGGLTAGDIKNIQNDVESHGIDAVLSGLPANQQKLVKDVYANGDTSATKLTRESVSSFFGIPDDDANIGGIHWDSGQGLNTGGTNSQKLDETMNFITKYQAVGYSDDDILKMIKEGQEDK